VEATHSRVPRCKTNLSPPL